jgi:hypothetical protein
MTERNYGTCARLRWKGVGTPTSLRGRFPIRHNFHANVSVHHEMPKRRNPLTLRTCMVCRNRFVHTTVATSTSPSP